MIIESDFKPAPYLKSAHLQTIFASKVRPEPKLETRDERLELPDGDFIDLCWLPGGDGPVVIVLHGLTGSIKSKYARGLLQQAQALGWRGVLMHFRGASETINRKPRSYHSGDTGDFNYLVGELRKRFPDAPLAAVGYSLGANVLLKWLGERGDSAPLATATAVSVPFDLQICANAVNHGLSRLYRAHLLGNMRHDVERKFAVMQAPFDLPDDLSRLKTFQDFDDAVTAPMHGFAGYLDYYQRASCKPFLRDITVPTLIIHSRRDPFMDPVIVPGASELSATVRLELSDYGGHVGFVSADKRGRPTFWLEQRIPTWLQQHLHD